MKTIVLCGKQSDSTLAAVLTNALQQYGAVRYYNEKELTQTDLAEIPDFCIYDSERMPKITLRDAIVVFKNSFAVSSPHICLPDGLPVVFGSQNVRAAEQLKGSPVVPVVCGTSSKDTLSVASLTEGSASVSLQRSIRTLQGDMLEPKEIAIRCERQLGPYPLLAACAVLLLCGMDAERGYLL